MEDAYPLVDLQAGMLFHSAYSPQTAVYHDVFSSRIRAAFDEDRLREAIRRVMGRHAVLRTRFALSGYSVPLQLVQREAAVPLAVTDLRSLGAEGQSAAVRDWLEGEKGRPFDWTAAPLFRLQVHRLSADVFQFSLSFHHAILDGWSVATLLAELFQQYAESGERGAESGEGLRPAPGLAYRDFVALESRAVESGETASYWEQVVGSAVRTQLQLPVTGGTAARARWGWRRSRCRRN